jgi:hypothetical protein
MIILRSKLPTSRIKKKKKKTMREVEERKHNIYFCVLKVFKKN